MAEDEASGPFFSPFFPSVPSVCFVVNLFRPDLR